MLIHYDLLQYRLCIYKTLRFRNTYFIERHAILTSSADKSTIQYMTDCTPILPVFRLFNKLQLLSSHIYDIYNGETMARRLPIECRYDQLKVRERTTCGQPLFLPNKAPAPKTFSACLSFGTNIQIT